jgi:hypothetical protein
LKPTYDEPLSNFAFNFNLRRYIPAHQMGHFQMELASPASSNTEPVVKPNFIFDEMPVVTALSPSSGSVDGANTITAGAYTRSHFRST